MKPKITGIVLIIAFLISGVIVVRGETVSTSTATSTSNATEDLRRALEAQIQARAKDLEKVNSELLQTQKNLNETKNERKSLQQELNKIQYTTNQLKLNIQADEITINKLNLEIQTLTFDIQDIQGSMKDKRAAIAEIFRELQQASDAKFLFLFLKNKSITDSILQAQALNDLNFKLTVDMTNLKTLQEDLGDKLQEYGDKRQKTNLHQRNLENRRLILQDQQKERQTLLTQTKSKETLYEKQVADLQKLQEEIAEEIETIDAELRAKIDPSLLPSARPGVLGLPVEEPGILTQGYGATDFARTAYAGKNHNGIDFRAVVGAPIFAAESGTVVAVGDQDAYCYRGAYGKFIVINHDKMNLTTLYAHLSRQAVSKGDKVTRGELIGYAGKTGYATGPHLHFTVFAQQTFYMGQSRTCGSMPFGGDLNPRGYLDLTGKTTTS